MDRESSRGKKIVRNYLSLKLAHLVFSLFSSPKETVGSSVCNLTGSHHPSWNLFFHNILGLLGWLSKDLLMWASKRQTKMGEDKSRHLAEDRITFYYWFQSFPTLFCNWAHQQLHLSRRGSQNNNRAQQCKKKIIFIVFTMCVFLYYVCNITSNDLLFEKSTVLSSWDMTTTYPIPQRKDFPSVSFLTTHCLYKKTQIIFLPILEMLKLINTSHISAILISTPFPCPWISGRTVQTKIQQSLTHTLWTSGFLYKNQINLTWLSLGLQHSSPWIRY